MLKLEVKVLAFSLTDQCLDSSLIVKHTDDLLQDCFCGTEAAAPLAMAVGVFHCFCNG